MSRYLVLALFLLPATLMAAPANTPKNEHDLAYSLGASLGERLRTEVPDLQLDALLEGLSQAYQNKPLALSKERIAVILSEHETRANEAVLQAQSEQMLAAEKRFLTTERARAGVRELAAGILATELVKGSGPKPTATGKVQVRYVGKLPDGTIFDQNQQPQWFKLDSVIEGWQVALPEMATGSKWRLVIPSAQAYGPDGAGDLIAPYTPLVFEIELIEVAD
ncbi:FKBP-type peptidyl-prolyl cis-trans isomerase [Pseudomonas auratipiscis]|uniref:Peptidyl-prolyl cis-trans isomerase n=1 Tax=Pseudomonas auratipiscis TaxID=3115853 RepID=A0AB35WTY0_9PSED|nr:MULTISPECIES: FKBP-type peptidyl-prolyl cis-trans isomerase [unclassified Pseudomonas]MEE1865564.1 FKBP-type peptidyl-prolyl cis-trans isomerase [Pseudomonas sp. 120P]MEE1956450.1 FKBP-type peptidyl-prolyl cis-trans isomerase [Pseudomonas sp. 119P]